MNHDKVISKKLVGRTEYLNTLNKTLSSDYIKLEELADGVAFLKLLYKLHIFDINFHKKCKRNEEKVENIELLDHLLVDKYRLRKQRLPIRDIARGQFKAIFDLLKFMIDYMIEERPDLYYISQQNSVPLINNDANDLIANNNNNNNNHNNTNEQQNIASPYKQKNDQIYSLIEQLELNLQNRIQRCQYKLEEISHLKTKRDGKYKSLVQIERLCNEFRNVFDNSTEFLCILYDEEVN